MSNRIEVIHRPNGDVIEITRNEKGWIIKEVVNEDPKHHRSCQIHYDEQGVAIGCLYGDNPKHHESWEDLFNERCEKIGQLWGEDPEHFMSWVYIYDNDGKPTHRKIRNKRILTLG